MLRATGVGMGAARMGFLSSGVEVEGETWAVWTVVQVSGFRGRVSSYVVDTSWVNKDGPNLKKAVILVNAL